MLTLIKSIVDPNCRLIGFVMEGKESEFGGILQNTVEKPISIQELVRKKFNNKQIMIDPKTHRIITKGKFLLNTLPMCMLTQDNTIIDIDNGVEVVERFVKYNEVVGFRLKFAWGEYKKMTVKETLMVSRWFKPVNYTIRTSKHKGEYVAGRVNGIHIDELPTIDVSPVVNPKKPRKKWTKMEVKPDKVDNLLTPELSIIEVFDKIKELDGLVIKLPDEDYKAAGKNDKRASEEFIPLGVGEVASPYISYGASKLNANANFKKIGRVNVPFNGREVQVDTYTFNTKSIFYNGDSYIKRLGVALPTKEACEEFVNAFGRYMAITPIKENYITQPIKNVQGNNDLVFFEVDTSRLSIMGQKAVDSSILAPIQIRQLLVDAFAPKLMCKYLSNRSGLIKELKSELPSSLVEEPGIAGYLAHLNPDFLEAVANCGVDIHTGRFIKTVEVPKDQRIDENSEANPDTTITIEYAVDKMNPGKITYKNIKDWAFESPWKLPDEVVVEVNRLAEISSPIERLAEAERLLKVYTDKVDELNRKLWNHRCAMFLKANKTGVHSHDKQKWAHDVKKKSKAKVYRCKVEGCTDLCVALLNTDII